MMAIYMVREVICEPKKDSISRATSQVPRYNHQQQEIHLFLPTICFCKRFNAYNHMAPYAFPSTHPKISHSNKHKWLWAFWIWRLNWMLVAVKMIFHTHFASNAIKWKIIRNTTTANKFHQVPTIFPQKIQCSFSQDGLMLSLLLRTLSLAYYHLFRLLITHPPWLCY